MAIDSMILIIRGLEIISMQWFPLFTEPFAARACVCYLLPNVVVILTASRKQVTHSLSRSDQSETCVLKLR